jgi:hypothetical protein
MLRDLSHHTGTDPDNHLIGYVRDLLIDEVDWKCASCRSRWAGTWASVTSISRY